MSPSHVRCASVALVALVGVAAPASAQVLAVSSAPAAYTALSNATPVTLSSPDDGYAVVPLGFAFPYYGANYSSVLVSANGALFFDAANNTPQHPCAKLSSNCRGGTKVPDTTRVVHNVIAPWWGDLFQQPGGGIRYSKPAPTELVIEYFEYGYYNNPSIGKFNLQVRLNASGLIQVHYGTHSTPSTATGLTAGFEDLTGANGAPLLPCATTDASCDRAAWPENTLYTVGKPVKADLVVQDVTLANMNAAGANLVFDVNASFQNYGQTAANGFTWKAFLSTNNVLDAQDQEVFSATTLVNAAAGGAATAMGQVTVAPKPAPGSYYVLVQVNPNNAIDEASTNNNVKGTVAPFSSGTDLQAVSVSGPLTATLGANLPVAVRFTNTSLDPVPMVNYRVLLSLDKTVDATDRVLHEASVPVSGAQTVDQSISAPLPSGVTTGDYYLGLVVDANNALVEALESNNTVFSNVPVKVELPDVTVTAVDFLDANGVTTRTGYLGQPAKVRVTVSNLGKVSSPGFMIGVLLSEDATAHFGNDTIFHDEPTPGLQPNETRTVTFDVQLPTTGNFNKPLTTREYYLFASADSLFTVLETADTNNTLMVPGAVRLNAPAADYTFGTFTVPAKVAPGDAVPIHRSIRNVGEQPGSEIRYRYYASANELISPSDFPLRLQTGQGLAAFGTVLLGVNERHEATENVILPADLPPGSYFLGALLDEERVVAELDEGNNGVVSGLVQVGSSGVRVATSVLPDAILDHPYEAPLRASGLDGPGKWTVDAPLPDGLLLTEEGVLSGTPKLLGNGTITVRVTQGLQEASARLLLRVLPVTAELQVSSVRLPSAVKGPGLRYEVALAAAGGVAPYRWRVRGGSLPAGLTLSDNGVISGAVESQVAFNSYPITFEVRDAAGSNAVQVVPVRVVEPTALLISEAALPNGMVSGSYHSDLSSHVAASTTPSTDVTWAIVEGALPDGLAVSTASGRGIISGSPTRSGVFNFVVQAVDSRGRRDAAQFTVMVFGLRAKVKSANLPANVYPTATAEFAFTFDTQKEARFSLFSGTLPPGLTLADNGTVTGTVAENAPLRRYDFIVNARDTDGTDGYGPFALEVVTAPKKKQGCAAVPGDLLGAAGLALIGMLKRRRRW